MKSIILFITIPLLFTLLNSPFILRDAHAATIWQQVNGPYGGDIRVLAIDPVTPQTLYAGTEGGGVFKTVNSGGNWSTINTGLTNKIVHSLKIDPSTPQTVYAGTEKGGVFKSINGGMVWRAVNTGLTNTFVRSLAIDPASPQTIYTGTDGGVFKSIDGGANWSAFNTGLQSSVAINAIKIDLTTPQTIYAGTSPGGVFKSINGGVTWSAVNTGLTDAYGNSYVQFIEIDPVTTQTIYAVTTAGIFKSINGGGNWVAINSGLTTTYIDTLAINPSTPQILFAGANNGSVFKSTNGGTSWSAVNTGLLANTSVWSLTIDPATPLNIYAGTLGGVFKTTNGGGAWNASNTGLTGTNINTIALDPSTPLTVYAGTYAGVYKSLNGGSSWSVVNNGLTNTNVNVLAIEQSTPLTIYAGTNGGIFKSVNGGTNWSAINNMGTNLVAPNTWFASKSITSLVINPSTPQTIYAGTPGALDHYSGSVYKTVNGGASWDYASRGLYKPSDNPLYLGSYTFVTSIVIDPANPETLYLGATTTFADSYVGVFKSVDGGGSWVAFNNGLIDTDVFSMVIDPTNSQTVYAGTYTGGVFKTINGGTSWSAVNSGLTDTYVLSLVVDPSTAETVYAGTYGGTFKSLNGGSIWSAVNTGLTYTYAVRSLAIDQATPQSAYAGTFGGAVFKTLPGPFEFFTVSKSGTGAGTVVSSPANISCGVTCSAAFASGTVVTLTATPADNGSTFTGWSGACSGTGTCTVTMDATKDVGAEFTAKINGVCGTSLNQTFSTAPVANLCEPGTASSATTSGNLWNWTCSGLHGGTNANCSANIQTYTVTTGVNGANVPLNCTSPVTYGSNSVCTITPVSGYQLSTFSDNTVDKLSSVTANSYTITNVTANHTIAATFSDIQKPVITAFTLPGTATTLAVAVSSLTATDNVAITGYLITESASAPLVSTTGWSTTKPTSYTFTGIPDGIATAKTLYAWAKDASGNISNIFSASTIITIPDATKPVVTSLTIPATGTTLAVAVSSLTATDNIGVIGYCLTETNSAAGCVWYLPAQTSYTFSGMPDGVATAKTLYAWANDLTGNISNSYSATTTITLPDVTKPVVTAFTIPTSSLLTVPVTTFTATDNIAVSGYCITETNSSTGCSWSATAPKIYNFTTAGNKTLYAWAKDNVGNISTTQSVSVIVDIAGPILALSTLADGAITNNATLNISGTVSDSGGVASLKVNNTTATITNGTFSYAVTMQAGANTITTVAADILGNTTTDTRSITLDITAPILTVSAPADNSMTAQSLATITGTINETSTVTVTLNTGTPVNATITGSRYSAAITLASGINSITITATDLAGNSSSAVRTVTYDNTTPSLAITYPIQDVTINQNSITINGTVSDTLTNPTVSISFNNQTYTPSVTGGTFSQKLTIPSEGTFAITVKATDEAGNSSSVTRNVIYASPVNGVCGTSNGIAVTTVPTASLCTTGTASAVSGSGPWDWTCAGTNGGAMATCSASITTLISKTGDCDANGTVTIAEVQSAINMFLGLKSVEACVDQDNNSSVSIAEVQKVINSFLGL